MFNPKTNLAVRSGQKAGDPIILLEVFDDMRRGSKITLGIETKKDWCWSCDGYWMFVYDENEGKWFCTKCWRGRFIPR